MPTKLFDKAVYKVNFISKECIDIIARETDMPIQKLRKMDLSKMLKDIGEVNNEELYNEVKNMLWFKWIVF